MESLYECPCCKKPIYKRAKSCPNCSVVFGGTEEPIYYPVRRPSMRNKRVCACCGEISNFPTEPGIWEYLKDPLLVAEGIVPERWHKVKIKRSKEEKGFLTMTPFGCKEPVWWVNNAKWRKVNETNN